jgi:uncharacterized membrane protein YgcG
MECTGRRKERVGYGSAGRWLGLTALALAMVSPAPLARTQDAGQPDAGQQGTGQPARAVRLSYVDGNVTLAQGSQVLAAQAVVNTPLFQGMSLTTADDGRAEIQFEDGSVVRLAPDSSLTLKVLSGVGASGDAELVLDRGLAYFELQGGTEIGPIRVHFGDSVATVNGFTVLRVKMDNPPGALAVFSGNAHLEGGHGALEVDLHGGESVTLNPNDPSQYNLAESIEPNSWDAWNSDRDQALTAEAADQTGADNNAMGGEGSNPAVSDLDANGSWYDVPDQGYVWSPYEAASADFDPYANGDWMYTPGYGYIWASAYPWGYLPFQCGMWNFYDNFGWGWAPGIGGCNPWWGRGYYGGLNIGRAPFGYRPIHRPYPGRHFGGRPYSLIAVNRRSGVVTGGLPARDFNTRVTIAGHTVQALRPLPARPGNGHAGMGFAYHASPAYAGTPGQSFGARPGYVNSRPGYTPAPRNAGGQHNSTPSRSYSQPSRGSSQPNRSYSAPSRSYQQPNRSYSAPRGSSGGGSSGGDHSFGGGGGGGGSRGGGGGGGGGGGRR